MKQISISFLILIIISLELCTFFISTVVASKTLKGHEFAKIDQCEKKFWWKNRKNFQKDLENLCMKQQHDRHDKYKKRFHKSKDCDKSESWNLKSWTNKKNTWENLDQRKCKSLKDKGRWKKSQKLLWKQFQKLSDCKCSAPNYKVTNPAGISVCYQIASLNKASGSFIGSFTVFRSLKYDKLKGKPASISIKYDEDIKVKIGRSNKDDGFINLKPLFTFKVKGSDGNTILVSKAFIEGKLPSKKSMNKICIDDISPVKYKVKVKVDKDTKKVFGLKLGSDVKNIPISRFIPSKPYSPYLIEPPDNNPGKNKEPPTTTTITQTQDQPTTTTQSPDPNQSAPTNPDPNQLAPTNSDSNQPDPTNSDSNQPDPTNSDSNQLAPTDAAPTDATPTDAAPTNNQNSINNPNITNDPNAINNPTPAENQQDSNSISSSADPTAPVANADSTATAAAANQDVPGSSISTPPIGLIMFAVVVAVGAAFVGYTTYERRRYRNQFNRRQNMQQQNPSLAAVPDFGRAV